MKRIRLTTGRGSEAQKLQNEETIRDDGFISSSAGALAEDIAARAYGYNSNISDSWYDARRGDSGAVIEVKSARSVVDSGENEAAGRFRLWENQHEKLLRYDRDDSAFYVFVTWDLSTRPPYAELVRKSPANIGHQVGARGGWYDSGHESRDRQYKLPITAVFPEE